jgi:hypothetical protein
MPKFQTKSSVVEAEQFFEDKPLPLGVYGNPERGFFINDQIGPLKVQSSDWIVWHNSTLTIYSHQEFELHFESIPESKSTTGGNS